MDGRDGVPVCLGYCYSGLSMSSSKGARTMASRVGKLVGKLWASW